MYLLHALLQSVQLWYVSYGIYGLRTVRIWVIMVWVVCVLLYIPDRNNHRPFWTFLANLTLSAVYVNLTIVTTLIIMCLVQVIEVKSKADTSRNDKTIIFWCIQVN